MPWSKALSFGLLPALPLVLLALTAGLGRAEITREEKNSCNNAYGDCDMACNAKATECGPVGSKNAAQCYRDCTTICTLRHSDCLTDADKDAPKPFSRIPRGPLPQLEQVPATPDVPPKGGIQQN